MFIVKDNTYEPILQKGYNLRLAPFSSFALIEELARGKERKGTPAAGCATAIALDVAVAVAVV